MIDLVRKQIFPVVALTACLICTVSVSGQTFSSGSTGADGAFSPTSNQTIQLPPNGIFNFTTINIPSNVTITFKRNAKNTPVTMLASGNVTILGTINLNGQEGGDSTGGLGAPGPGGFDGGSGGRAASGSGFSLQGLAGSGPGGGFGAGGGGGGGGFAEDGGSGTNSSGASGAGGPHYGTNTLLPLIGGSGGGGGGGGNGGNGGGGGGAILIASSTSISFGDVLNPTATISAQGGNSSDGSGGNGGGGGGAGGAIRLVSNLISGAPNLSVNGGIYVCCTNVLGGNGSPGFVRIEAFDLTNFRLVRPVAHIVLSQPTSINTSVQLNITSVAGINAPANPSASFFAPPDIVVPSTVNNPVTVAISAASIPTATVVQLVVTPILGARATVSSTPLSGSLASSTATASINLPAVTSVITASATINLSGGGGGGGAAMLINGEPVVSMEIHSTFGGKSDVTYVTASGRRVKMQ